MPTSSGPSLASAARANLAAFGAQVVESHLEQWAPDRSYDLVFAATAWHWADPALRYHKAAAALRPKGWLAFWAAVHVFPHGGDPFFEEIQPVYDEIGERVVPGHKFPRPGELADQATEIEASGLFEVVDVSLYA